MVKRAHNILYSNKKCGKDLMRFSFHKESMH
jgi:hypothetical protein